jgi:hypothetical protein
MHPGKTPGICLYPSNSSKCAKWEIQAAPTSIFLPLTLFHSIAAEPTKVKAAMIAATRNACVSALLYASVTPGRSILSIVCWIEVAPAILKLVCEAWDVVARNKSMYNEEVSEGVSNKWYLLDRTILGSILGAYFAKPVTSLLVKTFWL